MTTKYTSILLSGGPLAEALNWPNHLTGYESSKDDADFPCAIDIRLANP